jgi:peptidoglycan/LPS O-acetylase OafA/YrhL
MRNPSLDVLRAAAVLLVFCYHSEGAWLVGRFGWTGVDLFFVLSGFLVSGLLFREYRVTQQVRAGRFLMRRGFKIYPQFYLFIAASVVVACFRGDPLQVQRVVAELLFVQNYATGMWTHTWSLAIEEHFYILLTLVIVMLARRGGANPFRVLPGWIAISCTMILGLRILTWRLHPHITGYTSIFPTHLRVDSLLAGVLISYYHTFHPASLGSWMRRFGAWVAPASILLLAPVTFLTREDAFMVTIGFSLVSWGFALLLVSVLYPTKSAPAPSRAGRAMAGLGRVSYAFYLWQAPILAVGDTLKAPPPLVMALTFGASLLLAVVTTRLIETPFLRLRERCLSAEASVLRREPATDIVMQTS